MNPVWKFLISLRLTVICLALGIVLVFCGTIAQVNEGLWNGVDRWFRSFFIWWKGVPVFPGGYFIGIALLVNLIAAHAHRFQWSWRKAGINLTHLGIILLLLGQLLTDWLSVESHMRFHEGESRSYSESHRENELVFATDSANGQEEVVSIPESFVANKGEIAHEKLPFVVRVKEYHINSDVLSESAINEATGKLGSALATVEGQFSTAEGLVPAAERAMESPGRLAVWEDALRAMGETDTRDLVGAAKRIAAQPEREGRLREELKTRFHKEMVDRFKQQGGAMRLAAERLGNKAASEEHLKPASTEGAGKSAIALPRPETKAMDTRNLPFAVIELVQAGQSLGTWLVSPWLDDQELTVGGKTWRTAFRWERYYIPFSVKLLKTTHEVYRGTEIPKNFQSRVRLENPKDGENREVDIYMNNPLRYAGLTFYQYQMGRDEMAGGQVGTSTLQVVRNPSWITPYVGCIVVAVGMCWQFGYHLIGFIRKRRQSPARS